MIHTAPRRTRIFQLSTGAKLIRSEQWWSFKLAPILGVFYATLLRQGIVPGLRAVEAAGLLLVGMAACAAYVSLSNDLADRADDRMAGKVNRLQGRSVSAIAGLLALPLLAGAIIAWAWRADLFLVLSYAASWVSFTLYSLPPTRLKARGLGGVAADAAGAHLFPSLTAALAALHVADAAPDPLWLLLVALWSGAYGVRGILWHQLFDLPADRASATGTFVQRRGPEAARRLVARVTFPLEILAFAGLLALTPGPAGVLALGLYGVYFAAKVARFQLRPVLLEPRERYILVLMEFYVVFWPVALLLQAGLAHPASLALLAIHCLLFCSPLALTLKDAIRVTRGNVG